MSAYLKTYPADDRNTPVQYVCIHPIVWNDLMNGETIDGFTGKQHEPACLANDYEFDSPLHEICVALGWQGGTVHQVVEEIKRLRAEQPSGKETVNIIEGLQQEANRRRELLPQYQTIGSAGAFGAVMLRMDIQKAEKAIASGDVVEMVAIYKELSEAKID